MSDTDPVASIFSCLCLHVVCICFCACRYCLRIPRYAVELSEHVDRLLANPAEDIVALQTSLSRLIHAKGINIRHLGALFTEATTHACRMMLLIEMVSVYATVLCGS